VLSTFSGPFFVLGRITAAPNLLSLFPIGTPITCFHSNPFVLRERCMCLFIDLWKLLFSFLIHHCVDSPPKFLYFWTKSTIYDNFCSIPAFYWRSDKLQTLLISCFHLRKTWMNRGCRTFSPGFKHTLWWSMVIWQQPYYTNVFRSTWLPKHDGK